MRTDRCWLQATSSPVPDIKVHLPGTRASGHARQGPPMHGRTWSSTPPLRAGMAKCPPGLAPTLRSTSPPTLQLPLDETYRLPGDGQPPEALSTAPQGTASLSPHLGSRCDQGQGTPSIKTGPWSARGQEVSWAATSPGPVTQKSPGLSGPSGQL